MKIGLFFNAYNDSDAIVVAGFGFNKDDSHINGLFRERIERHGKRLFVVKRKDKNDHPSGPQIPENIQCQVASASWLEFRS